MCGLFGFTGRREAGEVLLDGIRRLEYRGYDSAGVVTSTGDRLHVRKRVGRVADLARALNDQPAPGCHGIAHTRWATHGGVTEANAHPHTDATGDFALVHNGVIENFAALKRQLQAEGVTFQSDTDTEVLAHLVARSYDGDLLAALREALAPVKGTYGVAVVSRHEPGVIAAARLGSPLVVGLGGDGTFLASD